MTTKYPRISIVTPVFNRVTMIEQTILSVLGQHYPNLEYIIIDGGSTDGTVDVIRRYESQLAYWVSEPDNGMYDAIMKGFSHATGDVMSWINSDDMYHTNALHIIGQIFSQLPHIEWLTGIPTMYNAEGLCTKVFPIQFWSWQRFLCGDFRWIQQESTFWKRSLWEKVGGLDLGYHLAADFNLWCNMFHYAPLYTVNTILGGFRQHGSQLSILHQEKYEEEVREIVLNYGIILKRKNRYIRWILPLLKKTIKHRIIYDFDSQKWLVR